MASLHRRCLLTQSSLMKKRALPCLQQLPFDFSPMQLSHCLRLRVGLSLPMRRRNILIFFSSERFRISPHRHLTLRLPMENICLWPHILRCLRPNPFHFQAFLRRQFLLLRPVLESSHSSDIPFLFIMRNFKSNHIIY